MGRKKYNEDCNRRNDPKARKIMIEVWDILFHHTLIDNPDGKYATDLMEKDGKYYVELEHREGNWKSGGQFPFNTLHVPERKRYLSKGDTVFISLSIDWSTMAIVSREVCKTYIIDETLTSVWCINVDSGEYEWGDFFNIPLEEVIFYMIKEKKFVPAEYVPIPKKSMEELKHNSKNLKSFAKSLLKKKE